MDLQLPANLHATRDLLTRSLIMHPEQAPAMPSGLASDLAARSAPGPAAPRTVALGWFEKVRGFLSTPAFGAVAAAVVVLGVAVPLLSGPASDQAESFRGLDSTASGESVRIVFVGNHPEILTAVQASGSFESTALCPVNDMMAAGVVPGPKVIVDFTSGTITAINHKGETVDHSKLPAVPAEVADAIAAALTRL